MRDPIFERVRRRLGPATRRFAQELRRPTRHPTPGAAVPPKETLHVRLATLNLAHGRGHRQTHMRLPKLRRQLRHIAETLRHISPDVVAFQEADGPSSWSGNFDHVATLAELAELDEHFRGNHNPWSNGRFVVNSGTAILANRPFLERHSHRFAESWRDTKGYVAATLAIDQWGGELLDVVSVHLDPLIPRVRRRQISQMIERLGKRRNPLVLLGDLNCCWSREPKSMRLLSEALDLRAFQPHSHSPTYPAWRPTRRLDWILISPELEFDGYGTLPGRLSDHLVVTADLSLR